MRKDGHLTKIHFLIQTTRRRCCLACAHILMVWAHHVKPAAKQELMSLTLPALPEYVLSKAHSDAVETRVQNDFACKLGHNMTVNTTSDHKWPHFPENLHYRAKAYGLYPFWLINAGTGRETLDMEAWYSEAQRAEKLCHSNCTYKGLGSGVPCCHLMLGVEPSPTSYLYNSDATFCCNTQPDPQRHTPVLPKMLTAIRSDFLDNFDYVGEEDQGCLLHWKGEEVPHVCRP